MNWKQRRAIKKRLRAIEHVEACQKERCAVCSRMLTGDKLIALGRDMRRVLASYDAVSSELLERMAESERCAKLEAAARALSNSVPEPPAAPSYRWFNNVYSALWDELNTLRALLK